MKRYSDLEYCEGDAKEKHFWERVGVYPAEGQGVFIVYRCSQCEKCKEEEVKT